MNTNAEEDNVDMERSWERMEVMIVIDVRRELGFGGLGSVNTILENDVGQRSNRLSRHHQQPQRHHKHHQHGNKHH